MPKTVHVRIAVAVDATGNWNAFGYSGGDESDADKMAMAGEMAGEHVETGELYYFLDADLPVPEPAEVAPVVTKAE